MRPSVRSMQRRGQCDVYHSALEVCLPTGRFMIEMTPIPAGPGGERGVVAEGPVGVRWLRRLRIFRYEVRRGRDGVIPDLDYAVASPARVTEDSEVAQRVFDLLAIVPTPVWGRDELHAGEMWSCNSIISWVLVRAGIVINDISLPPHGRAPGWDAGVTVARRTAVADTDQTAVLPGPPDERNKPAGTTAARHCST